MENLTNLFKDYPLVLILLVGILVVTAIGSIVLKQLKKAKNKLYRCTDCHFNIKKSQTCFFEESIANRKQENRLPYCQRCIRPLIENRFREFTAKAVMVYPDKHFNAYQFYTLSEFPHYGADKEYIELLNSVLPAPNQKCYVCEKNAVYAWYGHDFFHDDVYLAEINLDAKATLLCGQCLGKAFFQIIDDQQISLSHFVPPHDEAGLGKPWEL